jgi:hypothetical protein
LKWRLVGIFDSDQAARDFVDRVADVTAGRLGVQIGDFMFPVNDLEDGAWIVPKARKSYHHRPQPKRKKREAR